MRRGGSHSINADDLKGVKSFEDLAKLFHEKLEWPEDKWERFAGVPALYGIPEKELEGVVELAAVQKLSPDQEWGIFLVDFGVKTLKRSSLRRILHAVASRARATHTNPTWPHDNILFIVRERDGREFTFVHFRGDKLANARLRRFGWDESLEARTTLQRCLPQLRWQNQNRWNEAWDAEKLTKDFFAEYSRVFSEVESKVKGLTGDLRRRFTQSLFNRLMFLCFLQQKGWLEYRSGDTSARKRYLFSLFEKNPTEFYERLQLLFFSGLSSPNGAGGSRAALEREIGRVPFLNGGLFERDAELDTSCVTVPDEVFEPILGKNGLFQRYTFTVTESTPMDVEVALDPEMLGKIFEELVTGRHESGSYYTPRPVVSFMCREALKGYLGGYEKLVDEHDADGIGVSDAKELIKKLEAIKVCDPACGSGAYLLGMLQEIHALQLLLDTTAHQLTAREDYDRKLTIIQNCLYGVDIDPFAVNIASLRLWLSLIIDAEEPMPLPNLDVKVEAKDSLLGPSPGDAFGKTNPSLALEAINNFAKHKAAYMRTHAKSEKDALRAAMEEDRAAIGGFIYAEAPKGSLNWPVEFAEVFVDESGTVRGFDAVLSNPPYIRHELIKALKPALKKVFGELFAGTADLYTYFYFRGVQLLRPGGMFVFISSNKWFRAAYGEKLRAFMAANTDIRSITDFGDLPVFNATAYPMIFVAQKNGAGQGGRPNTQTNLPAGRMNPPGGGASPPGAAASPPGGGIGDGTLFTQVKSLAPPYPDVKALIQQSGFGLPADAIRGSEWTLADKETLARLRQMERSGVRLGEYVKGKIYYGIKTGFNEAFVIDGKKRAELIAEDPKSAEIIKPLAVGDDVRRWRIRDSDRWLIVTKIGVDMSRYPAVFKHLSQWKEQLIRRQDQGEHWWELRACAYYAEFDKPKIVYQEIATFQRFAWDAEGTYVNNKVFFLPGADLYLLAILNSAPTWEYLGFLCGTMIAGAYALQSVYVERLPIPRASDADRDAIAALVQKCLDAKVADPDADVSELEAEIDARVEYLYFHQLEAPTYDEWLAKKEAERGTVIEEIRNLLTDGESSHVEFKESLEYVNPRHPDILKIPESHRETKLSELRKAVLHSALKTVCAFANSKGGTLLLGVSDRGELVGLSGDFAILGAKQDRDGFENKLTDLLKSRIRPIPTEVDIDTVEVDGKWVCRIVVPAEPRPHYLDNELFVRLGNSTERLTGRDLEDWLSKRRSQEEDR
ncbi:MAG: hypothetical protein AKCLJLPJ_01442 [Fimbriimonadales bacterium]|nr:hypothetical protein [Fimbriimonadales bacterium]